jgi:hypothetical protein
MGRFPHPQTHVGEPHLWVRTHQRPYRALGMGGQNGCPAGNLRGNGPNTRNCVTRDHRTPPRPHPPPHPMGRFPHPQTHVGEPHLCVRTHHRPYRVLGMGGRNGCPAVNLRGNGPNTRNWATRGHVTPTLPHPPPHPMGRFHHPQTHVGEPHLWDRTHQRPYRVLGMGGQNGCPTGNLRRNEPNTRNIRKSLCKKHQKIPMYQQASPRKRITHLRGQLAPRPPRGPAPPP